MTKKISDFFALEGNYPDLDAEGAVARLSQAIQCRTINYADHSLTDYSEFDKLHAHMKASYPHVMRAGVFVYDFDKFEPEKLLAAFPEMQGLIPIALLPLGYPAEGAHPSRLHAQRKELSDLVQTL